MKMKMSREGVEELRGAWCFYWLCGEALLASLYVGFVPLAGHPTGGI